MVRIERAVSMAQVESASRLMDDPVRSDAAQRFLAEPTHHLLLAYLPGDDLPVGFVSGVETTHPDKGTEMFLYELGVDDSCRRMGVGTALVEALAALATELGCYGMWVLTDADNTAAIGAYRKAGGEPPTAHVMIGWTFAGPVSGGPTA
jgi:ribosomal protein S18 acetylase RimI-like enzyme